MSGSETYIIQNFKSMLLSLKLGQGMEKEVWSAVAPSAMVKQIQGNDYPKHHPAGQIRRWGSHIT